MLVVAFLAVLVAPSGVRDAEATAPSACAATPNCNLSQCPCYAKQIDNGGYKRPPGCVAAVRGILLFMTGRHSLVQAPVAGLYLEHQGHGCLLITLLCPAAEEFSTVAKHCRWKLCDRCKVKRLTYVCHRVWVVMFGASVLASVITSL